MLHSDECVKCDVFVMKLLFHIILNLVYEAIAFV